MAIERPSLKAMVERDLYTTESIAWEIGLCAVVKTDQDVHFVNYAINNGACNDGH
jgi:hypothetical protein